MNCKECRKLLEEFHDGELAEEGASGVRRHLAACPACSAELEVLKSEQALFERYRAGQADEAAAAVPKWGSVRESIAAREEQIRRAHEGVYPAAMERSGWFRFLTGSSLIRQAAFATLLVALSIAGTLIIVNRSHRMSSAPSDLSAGRATPGPVPVAVDSENAGLDSAMQAVRRAEQEYIQAIQLLNGILNKRKPGLDPRLVMEIETNLRTIDESIAATRRAYYARPMDPELAQYMLAAYSKKVELLQELVT